MDQTVMFVLAGVLIVGGLGFTLLTMNRRGPKLLDVDKYRTRWMNIEQQLKRDELSTYQLAIINADKLLDQALIEKAFSGQTMAERMKSAQKSWTNANLVWSAHKLRNRIAHEPDAKIGFDEARRGLVGYKQALKDVGAI
jgi:hypothetical protein